MIDFGWATITPTMRRDFVAMKEAQENGGRP